jgi:hypothetical protein
MAIAVVDEVMLREPRLLVPRLQPLRPVKIDWSNPLSRGLRFCWTPFAGKLTCDLVSGVPATEVGAGTLAGCQYGLAYSAAAGSGNGLSFGANIKPILANSSANTVVSYAAPVAGATGARQSLWSQGTDGSSPYRQYSLTADAAGAGASYSAGELAYFHYDLTMMSVASSSADVIDGGWHLWAGVRNGAFAAVYRDGVDVTAYSNNGLAVSSADTAGTTQVSGIQGSSRAMTGRNLLVLAWGRAIAPAELMALSADPFQLLTPA